MTEAARKLNRGNDVPRLDLRRRRDRTGGAGKTGGADRWQGDQGDQEGKAKISKPHALCPMPYFSIPFAIVCNCMLLVPS